MPYTSQDMATISETGPMIVVRSAKAQGLKAKHIDRVRAVQSNPSEGRSDTREGQHFGAPDAPSRGPDLLKLRI
jgi:hypothetical protein